MIGAKGGVLVLGPNKLTVPKGALQTPTEITGATTAGDVVQLSFAPSGLRFAVPAELRIDTRGCVIVPPPDEEEIAPLYVVYLDTQGNVIERIRAKYSKKAHTATAPISHFSSYALAW